MSVRVGPKGKKLGFRPDVQGLRAVAVVLVVLNHFFGWPGGGFVGVDVFFVISGFLITGLLLREHDETGAISFVGFYRRRFRRIIPAATLVLVATTIAAWLVFNSVRAITTFVDSVWALFFAANWHFAAKGTDYFQAAGPTSPVQHFWSLSVEEQFYFVWPWLMLSIFWLVAKLTNGRGNSHGRRLVGIAMIVITVASFGWALWESKNAPTIAYFSTFSRAWELGVGALIAVYSRSLVSVPARLRPFIAWLGLALMLIAFFFITGDTTGFPAPWALLPVAGAALVLIAGTGGEVRHVSVLTNPFARFLGDISYSLYLWHFPIFIIGVVVIGDALPQKFLLLGIAFVTTVYSYYLVENPIRNAVRRPRKRKGSRTRRPISRSYQMTALSLLAVVTIGMVAAAWPVGLSSATPTLAANTAAPGPGSTALASKTPQADALNFEVATALQATSWPELNPTLESVIGTLPTPADIGACSSIKMKEKDCTWGDPNATHTIVMVGRSLSLAYVEAVRAAIGTKMGWRVISYGMFGCPFDSEEKIATLPIIPDGCPLRTQQDIDAINRLQPDVVLFSGMMSGAGASTEIALIEPRAKLVFLPGPPADADIATCYSKVSSPSGCITKIPEGWAQPERLLAASRARPGIYIDPIKWFCFKNQCPAFVGTTPVKVDKGHISSAYADKIAPTLLEAFQLSGVIPKQ